MTSPFELSLISGPVPVVVAACGAVAALFLLGARRRAWWTRVVPLGVTACELLALGWRWSWTWCDGRSPSRCPRRSGWWCSASCWRSPGGGARWRRAGWPRRVLDVVAVLVLLVSDLAAVNQHFGQCTTLRTALGNATTVALDVAAKAAADVVAVPAGKLLADLWTPPAGLPERGTVSETPIPSSSEYRPQPALVYLPPAYAATRRPRLPVLVLLSGQPGSPCGPPTSTRGSSTCPASANRRSAPARTPSGCVRR
jgi:hypothetical protein